MKKRTITLTDRAPVQITQEAWPFLASHSDQISGYDWEAKWFLGIRQHNDGRAIVYGTYACLTEHGDTHVKGGYLLEAGQDVNVALAQLVAELRDQKHDQPEDAARWLTLQAAIVRKLPIENLD